MLASPDLLCHCIVYLTAQHTDIMPVTIRNTHDVKKWQNGSSNVQMTARVWLLQHIESWQSMHYW